MKLFAYSGKCPNFGDELNHWLWPKLLPGFFDDNPEELFLGIGSVLYNSHDPQAKKIVFGAGYAGYSPLPTIDKNWQFYFVRGKLTADILQLPPHLAVGDSGILIRSVLPYQHRVIKHEVSYMPHFESAMIGSWEAICRKLGFHYMDPRANLETLLEDMLASRLVISEAMHGVIIADALRIPWRAVLPHDPNHRWKWQDWASMLNVNIDFSTLGASNMMESIAAHCWSQRKIIYRLRKHEPFMRKIGYGLPFTSAIRQLEKTATLPGQLSDEVALQTAHQRMEALLEQLKSDYTAGSLKNHVI